MDLEKIKSFIKLAKEEGVSSLKYEEDDLKLEVDLAKPMTTSFDHYSQSVMPAQINDKTQALNNDKNHHVITSPFVGTFYSSPSPDAKPFVSKGMRISKGQTLCILEAMKIMNEIESDVAGEVIELCVENESLVEFGQPLFKVKI